MTQKQKASYRGKPMEHKTREYPQFAACGLNCGLCPRYYTEGPSRCPGCAGEGFSDVHPTCGILSCCQRKNIEYCFLCDEFPCEKYDRWGDADSFITHRNYLSDMEKAKRIGMDNYKAELNEKIAILERLLSDYNDSRRKGYFCLAINLLELQDIKSVMAQLDRKDFSGAAVKEKAIAAVKLFDEVALQKGIILKLRK